MPNRAEVTPEEKLITAIKILFGLPVGLSERVIISTPSRIMRTPSTALSTQEVLYLSRRVPGITPKMTQMHTGMSFLICIESLLLMTM